jgi:hypothetical protein
VKVFHIVPKDEVGLHDLDINCICEPKPVESHRIETEWLIGEVVFEHNFFSPLGQAQAEEEVNYKVTIFWREE